MFKNLNDVYSKYFNTLELFKQNKLEKPQNQLPMVQGFKPKDINTKCFNEGKINYNKLLATGSTQQIKKLNSKEVMNTKNIKAGTMVNNAPNKGTAQGKIQNKKADDPNAPKKKVFIVLGGYRDIMNNLEKRGWERCTNPASTDFDYIWTLKTIDINYNLLKVSYLFFIFQF